MLTSIQKHCDGLAASFAALYRFVDSTRVAWRIVIGLLAIHTGLLAYSAYVHSPTLNEPGHLVAGLSHWKFGRFELYRVNPPLVRMVAALPVMAVGYEEDWSGFYDGPGARPVFGMGEDFVAANGPRTFYLMMIARWACIPFSWLGAIVCYLWARDLYGRPAGLLACFLWCFEPNILAHASLITADAAGTALGIAACYTFWRWLKKPSWTQAALTGVVLGLAELAKTTLILFYPLWPLLWLFYRWPDRHAMVFRDWFREAGMLALRMIIGLYVVNLGYGFENSFTPLKEFQFVSQMLTGDSVNEGDATKTSSATHNRFADSWLGTIPVPFPKNYVLGIDIQQRDFESYGRPSYLRGEWRDHGWWYYYLYAGLIKVPLGMLLLGLLAMAVWLTQRFGQQSIAAIRDELVLLFPAIVIFVVVSSKTGFSEHFRYVLPVFPLIFVFMGRLARNCLTSAHRILYKSKRHPRRSLVMHFAATTSGMSLVLWLSASSSWVYPHSLSYFNESIGGPLNGAEYLLGSNVDWGQDVRYAADTLRKRHRCLPDEAKPCIDVLLIKGIYSPVRLGLSYRRSLLVSRIGEVQAKRLVCMFPVGVTREDYADLVGTSIFCDGSVGDFLISSRGRESHLQITWIGYTTIVSIRQEQ
jgi:hypothetical protein